ncbi:hypothetical protein [Panacagrimonas sp.]|uniref:hypothetical protein n=1 Tax=Panacagrimonas sp. TaxID=2480088 RepID=UPI003B522449
MSAAAALASAMGRDSRLLIGLGTNNPISAIQEQGLQIDFYDRYLPSIGGDSWINYNSPEGEYVNIVTALADSVGAIPMFTLYQMADNGDGNIEGLLSSASQMDRYWRHTELLFDLLGAYDKPAIVNLEPDFWSYVALYTDSQPTAMFAQVDIADDCADLPNDVTGVGRCLLAIARARAPKAFVGFPPASFGQTDEEVISLMNAVGAAEGDFMIQQTLDRDAGCFEADGPGCGRSVDNPYWDDAAFERHLAQTRIWQQGIGRLPVLWWQTPMGVPSPNPGGSFERYRDNRVDYFLRNPERLVQAGGVGVVFAAGANGQTTITSDDGQFRDLLETYLADPVPLP